MQIINYIALAFGYVGIALFAIYIVFEAYGFISNLIKYSYAIYKSPIVIRNAKFPIRSRFALFWRIISNSWYYRNTSGEVRSNGFLYEFNRD